VGSGLAVARETTGAGDDGASPLVVRGAHAVSARTVATRMCALMKEAY
jgi:hypothetical protein